MNDNILIMCALFISVIRMNYCLLMKGMNHGPPSAEHTSPTKWNSGSIFVTLLAPHTHVFVFSLRGPLAGFRARILAWAPLHNTLDNTAHKSTLTQSLYPHLLGDKSSRIPDIPSLTLGCSKAPRSLASTLHRALNAAHMHFLFCC